MASAVASASRATVPLEGVPPATLVGGTTEVEFARHSSGAQQVRFYDKNSGTVIDEFPAESVLNKVSALMDFVRRTV